MPVLCSSIKRKHLCVHYFWSLNISVQTENIITPCLCPPPSLAHAKKRYYIINYLHPSLSTKNLWARFESKNTGFIFSENSCLKVEVCKLLSKNVNFTFPLMPKSSNLNQPIQWKTLNRIKRNHTDPNSMWVTIYCEEKLNGMTRRKILLRQIILN
jgi:hypothetical protein